MSVDTQLELYLLVLLGMSALANIYQAHLRRMEAVRFAVAVVLDQTIGYLTDTEGNDVTTKHPEARLFATLREAQEAASAHDDRIAADDLPPTTTVQEVIVAYRRQTAMIEQVDDVAEFRAREDTW